MSENPTKRCSRCEKTKCISLFHRAPYGLHKRAAMCKECKKEWVVQDRAKKLPEYNARSKDWAVRNPDKIANSRMKNRSEKNRKSRLKAKDKYHADADFARSRLSEYRSKNPEKVREWNRNSNQKRYKNIKFRIENSIRCGISAEIGRSGKKGMRTFKALGYSSSDLMRHLEKKFVDGMSWENYGEWHIDHIIPLSAFNYASVDHIDFGRAWSLSNLQPLWAAENIRKHDSLSNEFQPCLAI